MNRCPGDDLDVLSKVSPRTSLRKQASPTPLTFWGLGSRHGSPLVGQSFQPSLPVNRTLSPCPDHLGPVHQAHGEVASPRPKGRPHLAGPRLQVGKLRRPSSLVRWGGDGADPGVKELVKGPHRRLVGIKHVASAGRFVSCHKPCLARRRPPPARCRLARVGERALTLPPAVSPQTSHPGSPFSGPVTIHPRERESRADTEDPVPLRGWGLQTPLRGGSLPLPPCLLPLPLPLAGHCLGTCVRKQRKDSSLFTHISMC